MTYFRALLMGLAVIPLRSVSKPENVIEFIESQGFISETVVTCGKRSGCNEFVFRRL
jgi:hypothetical protein